ncbi:unnamed protein product [Arctia plantaginis]|uniref:Amine oxidase domain-containing protein n=1 Tax=Arctia plantaginis TaxID=874455 RepID=A0A8S0ZX95_ARCPL|nr:unnamed protein product [Arctia plantaginis]
MLIRTVLLMALAALGNSNPVVPVYDTIIVGMGASGCAAASVLGKAGKNVLGLEAQNRIGGRVYTVPLGDGIVEVGAEWIHGERPNPVYDLALQHNVTILSQNTNFIVYWSNGSIAEKGLITDLLAISVAASLESTDQPEPVGQYVKKKITDHITAHHPNLLNDKEFLDNFFHLVDLMMSGYEGSDNWNELSSHSTYEDLEGDMHLSWNKNGFKTLFEILLNTYQGGPGYPTLTIQLEKEVTKITYPQDPAQDVVVTCKDGSIYKARNVIVTVSLGVLKESYENLFSPELPQSKITAIKDIAMGLIGKIILLFPNQWWDQDVSDAISFLWKEEDAKGLEDDWTYGIGGASRSMGNRNVVTLWSSGNITKTIEALPDDVVQSKAMGLIRRFMGKNKEIPEPIKMIKTDWFTNPYTRGTYSFSNIEPPQPSNIRDNLAEPLVDSSGAPRVLFAGEATNSIHFSTVNGAVESGFREGNRLVPAAA